MKEDILKNKSRRLQKRNKKILITLIVISGIIIIFGLVFVTNFSLTGFVISEENFTNEIKNETAKIFSLEGFSCKEFQEQLIWSSGYSNKPQGSTSYQVWYPKHDCTEIGVSNCFLGKMEVKARFMYFGNDDEIGEGYIQISEPDESICNNPEKGNYLDYLSYEELKGESKSFESYCGKNKKTKEKCERETSSYRDYANCYGIKAYGSQYMLVDVFEIKYYLCLEK